MQVNNVFHIIYNLFLDCDLCPKIPLTASENALLDKVVSEMSIDLYSIMYPIVNQLGILFAHINVLGFFFLLDKRLFSGLNLKMATVHHSLQIASLLLWLVYYKKTSPLCKGLSTCFVVF